MLSKEDLARESSVVITALDDKDEEPRLLDVPRDTSGPNQPFFKLPLPDEETTEEEDYDDVVIVSVGGDEEVCRFCSIIYLVWVWGLALLRKCHRLSDSK